MKKLFLSCLILFTLSFSQTPNPIFVIEDIIGKSIVRYVNSDSFMIVKEKLKATIYHMNDGKVLGCFTLSPVVTNYWFMMINGKHVVIKYIRNEIAPECVVADLSGKVYFQKFGKVKLYYNQYLSVVTNNNIFNIYDLTGIIQ